MDDARQRAADGVGPSPTSPGVVWQPSTLTRRERWAALGRIGATVWLTGLPAAGKSTLGDGLERRLIEGGVPAMRLDGDNLRHGLNGDLGFRRADRSESVRRTAHAARLLAEAGTVAIVTLVSPYAADREAARAVHAADGLVFLEVFLDTPLAECERRDRKGLYARARAGTLTGMTGIDDPYEPPGSPELTLRPGDSLAAVDQLAALLRRHLVLTAGSDG